MEDVEMDEALWGSLPDHILEKVLTMLPWKNVFRFRTVCKRWNAFPSSRAFLRDCTSTPGCCEPWLVVTNPSRSFAYSPYSEKLSDLPPSFFQHLWFSEFLATEGGLVMRAPSEDGSPVRLHVFNPFTGFERELPEVGRPYAAQILMDSIGHSYRIVALCHYHDETNYESRWLLETYNSISNSWHVMSSQLPRGITQETTMVVCNEVVYCTIGSCSPFGVWEFNSQTGAWYLLNLPDLPNYARFHLVGCQGRLLLVARIKDQIPDAMLLERIYVWQLDQQKKEWIAVLEVPDAILGPMGSRGWTFSCRAHGDILIFIFKDMLWTKILVYNFTTGQISCGPSQCTVLSTKEVLIYPRLSALV